MGTNFVGLGEVLWDLLPSGKALGGAPANSAFHAQQLGRGSVRSTIVSCVGADDLGREVLSKLDRLGVDRLHVGIDASHPTGTVAVSLDAAGVPTFSIVEDVAWDHITDTPALRVCAAAADVVAFGSLAQRSPVSRSTIQTFLDHTRPGALRIFDINLRQRYYTREIIEQSLRRATVLKINDQELPVVAQMLGITSKPADGDCNDEHVMSALAVRYGVQCVALTKGGRGSVLYRDGAFWRHPGCPITPVDTVGAGDAFTAALAVGLANGIPCDKINGHANRVAAYVCTQHGATPALPKELAE